MGYASKSGLDFTIDKGNLVFQSEDYKPAVKWSKSLEEGIYAYKDGLSELRDLYFGARYMEKTSDAQIFTENDFMADLTIINPGKVGEEFVKTVGHYHQNKPGTKLAYPEVYEAVAGKFEYLLQSEPDSSGHVEVLWVVAESGDKIVMPPNYGHVSMNVGDDLAIEVDLQKRDNPNGSDYSVFKEKKGGAFYRTSAGLEKNPNYEVSSLRIVKPKEKPEWGLEKSKPLYTAFTESPEKFDYLLSPENYTFDLDELFEDIEL